MELEEHEQQGGNQLLPALDRLPLALAMQSLALLSDHLKPDFRPALVADRIA